MVYDFIISEEGRLFLNEFNNKFKCIFAYEEPGNIITVEDENGSFEIPENETVENFKKLISNSIKIGKNLLLENYNKFVYDDNVIPSQKHIK